MPGSFFGSLPKLIRNELISKEIVKKEDKVLGRIRSVLRTEWITPEAEDWNPLLPIMLPLHVELTRGYWWQDVGIPTGIVVRNTSISPIYAQIYELHKRRCNIALQLPRETL